MDPLGFNKRTKSSTIIRLICWILSTVGLGWQVEQISRVYFAYQTQVDMVIESPKQITMPGLTMCLRIDTTSDVNYTNLISIFPPARGIVDWARRVNHNASIYRYVPINVLAQLPTQKVKIICETPFPELEPFRNFSSQSNNYECKEFTQVKTTIQFDSAADDFWRCSTYFYTETLHSPYLINKGDDKDFYKIKVYSEGTTSIFNYDRTSFVIYLHNPMETLHLTEADSFQFFVESTERMILTTSKIITYLLPPPFRTGCVEYTGVIDGRTGCIYQCRVDTIKKTCPNSWAWAAPADPDQTESFAPRDRNCLMGRKFECSRNVQCPPQCLNYWYTTTLIVKQERRIQSNLTEVYVRRPFGVEIIYRYLPRMNTIEYLCYIASCFGIWFGISFLDIIYVISDFADKWMLKRQTRKLSSPFESKSPKKSKISLGSLRTA